MRLETLPLDAAIGHILCHNLPDSNGRKAFVKGHTVRTGDLPFLREMGLSTVRVAVLEPDDIHEDEAARRLAAAVIGAGLVATKPHTGRVNVLVAEAFGDEQRPPEADAGMTPYCGVLDVDAQALTAINDLDGLTVATLHTHTPVRPRQAVATIKVIPFAVPAAALHEAAAIGRAGQGVLRVRPLRLRRVGVVLVSSVAARRRIESGVYPAIEGRIQELGAAVVAVYYVELHEAAVAGAVSALRAAGVELIIVAGETSIVDVDDVTPQGIRRAGGRIEHYGAPVEPGNLLLLAYVDPGDATQPPLPIMGAPGCVRSRSLNIVDMLLPRLMAGEIVGRRDIIALGHGGLLE